MTLQGARTKALSGADAEALSGEDAQALSDEELYGAQPLEMGVNADQRPVKISLAGRLDAWTSGNILPIMEELISDGFLDFELKTSMLDVADEVGLGELRELRTVVAGAGGRLTWDGVTRTRRPLVAALATPS